MKSATIINNSNSLDLVNISRAELCVVEYVWDVMMYKIARVSSKSLKFVYAFTKFLPLWTDLLIRQRSF